MNDRTRLYQRLPVTEDVAWWSERASHAPGGTVLYLGCGTGRLAAPLAQVARRLVGVDIDPAMLAAFRARLDASELAGRVALVQADVARLDLDGARFGLVVLPSSLLNGITDPDARAATLTAAAAHCAQDGQVVLQVLNPYWMAHHDPSVRGRLEPADGGPPTEVVIRQLDFDPWAQRQRAQITYRFPDGEEMADDVDAVAIHPQELRALTRAAGLRIVERWGARPGSDPLSAAGATWHLICRPAPA